MNQKNVIYVVDDNAAIRESIVTLLEEYQCVEFSSGQECLESIEKNAPDAIILDVNMPGLNGFETCEKIKAQSNFYHIPIIFISSSNGVDDRIKGYAAGGDDYIGKPIEPTEILAKVASALKRKQYFDEAREQVEQATLSVNDIMSTLSEHSIVIHFMQNSFSCNTLQLLADSIISAVNNLNLSIAIEFSANDEYEYFSLEGEGNDLEKSVFEYVRDKAHVVDVGKRAAFNFPKLSILVRNMPMDNPTLRGRIKDHISLIGRAAEAKLIALNKDIKLKEQHKRIVKVLNVLSSTVSSIESDYDQQRMLSEAIFQEVNDGIEDSFLMLGLSDQQETYQREIIESGERKIQEVFGAGLTINEKFSVIVSEIEQILEDTKVIENEIDEPQEQSDNVEFF